MQLTKSQILILLENNADFRREFTEEFFNRFSVMGSCEVEYLAEKLAGYHWENGKDKIAAIKQLRAISGTIEIPSKYNPVSTIYDGKEVWKLGLVQAKQLIEKYWK